MVAKADRRPREKKKFYHQFSIVKYSYLPTDTFRKYVEMHVTRSKLTLKFIGYCRQTSYTDSAVIHTLVPEIAWVLESEFAQDYMHFKYFLKASLGRHEYFTNGWPCETSQRFTDSSNKYSSGANHQPSSQIMPRLNALIRSSTSF